MENTSIRIATVKLLGKLMLPLCEAGVIAVPERNEILAQLKHLATKGTSLPPIEPRLIDQTQAAELLGISLANFKRIEKENGFPFQRRKVGNGAVRYRNLDLYRFIMGPDDINLE